MKFSVSTTLPNSLARTGRITTPHGEISTPVFMPVGTTGIVKTMAPWEMKEVGAEIILGNTYHLHVRPGEKLIDKLGGLHKWSSWDGPILTDSGGYQAYSLGITRNNSAKTSDEGVRFSSHIDGKKLFFTPESVLDIQRDLGSDIAMVLDDCPPIDATEERATAAINRTADWAKRSIGYWKKERMGESGRALFGIIQGGLSKDMRLKSMADIQNLPFDGIAVGGVAIESEGKEKINKAVEYVASSLDKTRPHYLMGVGEPEDLIRMVHMGIDMFDCVIPTRFGRHGSFWLTKDYRRVSISLSSFTSDDGPLDPDCSCKICRTFSRSYLRHLFMIKETFVLHALSYHNLSVVIKLMSNIRSSIEQGTFTDQYKSFLV